MLLIHRAELGGSVQAERLLAWFCGALLLSLTTSGCRSDADSSGSPRAPKTSAAQAGSASAPRASAAAAPNGAPVAAASAARPARYHFTAARPIRGRHAPPAVNSLVVGDGFGCAAAATRGRWEWQCWQAPGRDQSAPLRAFRVPWLEDKDLQAGPDRVCEFARPALTFRCWERPQRGESAGRELPAHWQWLNPNGARWAEAFDRADWVREVSLGGSFACLTNAKSSVWCLGDNRFGQLGGSQPVPPPDAEGDHPAFVRHISVQGWSLALGTWHACATARRPPRGDGEHVACWGRGDHGQLGAAPADMCVVDGVAIPCAKTPVKGHLFSDDSPAWLRAGDLFTCRVTPEGIACWGANRDGFFGKPGSCPKALRKAWPTLEGPVAAPRAACSASPTRVRGVSGFQQEVQLGPRGLCFEADGFIQCIGAIKTPPLRGLSNPKLSLGSDASACALHNKGVVCWGEGYSPSSALHSPRRIQLEAAAPILESAVVGRSSPEGWSASCLINRGCNYGAPALERCAPALKTSNWSDLANTADQHLHQRISVRGPLGVGALFSTLVGCQARDGRACCNRVGGPIVLGGPITLPLHGLSCGGDESLSCCNAPAYGQSVVATGTLVRGNEEMLGEHLALQDVSLCSEH